MAMRYAPVQSGVSVRREGDDRRSPNLRHEPLVASSSRRVMVLQFDSIAVELTSSRIADV
jgi:hypothetical protein